MDFTFLSILTYRVQKIVQQDHQIITVQESILILGILAQWFLNSEVF